MLFPSGDVLYHYNSILQFVAVVSNKGLCYKIWNNRYVSVHFYSLSLQ